MLQVYTQILGMGRTLANSEHAQTSHNIELHERTLVGSFPGCIYRRTNGMPALV